MLTKYSHRHAKLRVFIALITLCVAGLFIPATLPAANAGSNAITVLDQHTEVKKPENKDLDVVLVMDSSGSMKKTDPKELRKPAAKLFISLLGAHDRAGVVSFSDQGYPVGWLTPVKGDKNRRYLFKSVDKISSKGVYTNLQGALNGAIRVLNRASRHAKPKRAGKHQQIIVLMSDGKMDLGNKQKSRLLTDQLLNDTLPSLKQQGIEVHTIAFTPQSDQDLLKKIADATGGTFNIARSDRELHDAYTAIFEQNKSPNILPFHGDKFTIDKAIKEVTIVGSKESARVVLSLMTPDGRMLTPNDKGKNLKWFTSDQFDLITITNPADGEWQLKASAGKNKAYVITDLKQQLQISPREPAINEGVLVKTWLEDKGAILKKPSITKTLSVEMHVDTPDGQTHVLKMEPELGQDGKQTHSGAYTSLIALPAEGTYHFKVIASGRTFTREKDSIIHAIVPPPAEQPAQPAPLPKQPPARVAKPTLPTPKLDSELPPKPAAETEKPVLAAKTDDTGKKPEPSRAEPPPAPKANAIKPETPNKENTQPESGKTSVLTAVMIFVGINVLLSVIGGGVYFFIRKRRGKTSAEDEDDDDATPVSAVGKDSSEKDQAA